MPIDVFLGEKELLGQKCSRNCITKKWDKKYVMEHYEDEEIKKTIEIAGKYLGQYIIMACIFLNPEVVCIAGGITNYPGFFDSAKKYALENMSKKLSTKLRIELAKDKEYTGCIGAICNLIKNNKNSLEQ